MIVPSWPRATGLLLGGALDAVLADPRRAHPVAAFGNVAAWAEAPLWSDSRTRGAGRLAACVIPAAAGGLTAPDITRAVRLSRLVSSAALLMAAARAHGVHAVHGRRRT